MNQKIRAHFKKVDPILFAILDQVEITHSTTTLENQYFVELCETIISQQLSFKAAQTIFQRFKALFKKSQINPKNTVKLSEQKLRLIGLSKSKASYIKDLAQKVKNEEVLLTNLNNFSDEQIIAELIKVKGIGRWSAEMFLIFSLGREDVFSFSDLGLKNALKRVYGEKTNQEYEEIVQNWAPFRSYASKILWKSLALK